MRLPKSKALWPLFETIVNSIQSIEEVKKCTESRITIKAIRPEYAQMTTDGEEELTHFEEFLVTDNGEGFTEKNYSSFLEAYSTLKVKKVVKGLEGFYGSKLLNA